MRPARVLWSAAVAMAAISLVGLRPASVIAQKDPAISLKPSSGEPGDTIEITGSDFVGDAKVVVRLDGTDVASGLSVAGSFQFLFTVPEVKVGKQQVIACAYIDFECDAGEAAAPFDVVGPAPTLTKPPPAATPTPTGVVIPPPIVIPSVSALPAVPWLAEPGGPCQDAPFTPRSTQTFESEALGTVRIAGTRGQPVAGARSGTWALSSPYDDFGSGNRPISIAFAGPERQVAMFVGRDPPTSGAGPLTAVLRAFGDDPNGQMVELARASRELEEAAIPVSRCLFISLPTGSSFWALSVEYITADGQSSTERRWIDDLSLGELGPRGFARPAVIDFVSPADGSTVTGLPTDPLRVVVRIRSFGAFPLEARLGVNAHVNAAVTSPLQLAVSKAPGDDPFAYIAEGTVSAGLVADADNSLEIEAESGGHREGLETSRFRLVPAIEGNLRVLEVELNQAVQVPGNRVPLIAEKPTLVRVFVEGTADSRGPWGPITGELTTTTADGTRRTHRPLADVTPHARPISRYSDDSQLFFVLDRAETAQGVLSLDVAVRPLADRPQANTSDDRFSLRVVFGAPIDFEFYAALFRFPTGETNDWAKIDEFTRYVENVYPVRSARARPVPGWGYDPITVDSIWWLRYWTGSLLGRLPPDRSIFGLWPGTGIPRTDCPSPEPTPGASPTPVPSGCLAGLAYFRRTDGYGSVGFGPRVMAQELAHGEGLWWHAESPYESAGGIGSFLNPMWPWEHASVGHVGVDMRDPNAPLIVPAYRSFGDHTHDFMSYGSGTGWVSPYTYCALLDALTRGRTVCSAGVRDAPRAPEMLTSTGSYGLSLGREAEYLSIRGEVVWDAQSATLLPIESVYRAGSLPTMADGGAFTLEVADRDGTVLTSVPFTPAETHGREGQPVPFQLLIERPAGAARVTIKLGDKVLAGLDASKSAPVVAADAASVGTALRGSGELTWRASDEDGDALTSAVEVSPDGGETWWPAAVGLSSPHAGLDLATLPGSDDVWVRIQASDGFNSSALELGPFVIDRHSPTVRVQGLASQADIEQGRPITLRAVADDVEDGRLADSSVVWSSNLDGTLGSGEWEVTEELSVGEHQVTVTVTDRDGQTASASARVSVRAAAVGAASTPSTAPTGVLASPPSPAMPANGYQLAVVASIAVAVALGLTLAIIYRRRRPDRPAG